ncbi:MAG TPA: dihydrolipoyl dehydrogenase [Candidatus Omnitrophota bacterium]|nr:dihydrolipoyl dehydrogenase [Candidatus Omnitrophota bacterium]
MSDKSIHKQIIVIGAGPGGYTAAFRLADLGHDIALIDNTGMLGGVCLHQGCIASKTLLHAAQIISQAQEAQSFGITFNDPLIDIEKLRQKKNTIIQKLSHGLKFLSDKKKIFFINGKASFLNAKTIEVIGPDKTQQILTFDHAIIATGSKNITLDNLPISKNILNSSSALEIENIPKNLLIVGGGYIGLELGTIYSHLGSAVSLIEMTAQLLPGTDPDLTRILEKQLKSTFTSIKLNTQILNVKENSNGLEITLSDHQGKNHTELFEKILICVGRKIDATVLNLQNTKIEITPDGFIKTNTLFQTTEKHIYAIGDVTGKPFLAHKASWEGYGVADILNGQKIKNTTSCHIIPSIVYTDPEIASCGLTEIQAIKENKKIIIQSYPWTTSGRAMTLQRTDGLTKFIIEASSEKILGVSIVGVHAGELIMEGVLAIENGLKVSDLKNLIHPHPSLAETFYENALHFYGQNVHQHKS